MPLSPLEHLRHILDEAYYLAAHIPGVSREQFKRDETLKRAFVRSLEIIGEAIKKAPKGTSCRNDPSGAARKGCLTPGLEIKRQG
jgi:uncharacterized protein with HEPN domain